MYYSMLLLHKFYGIVCVMDYLLAELRVGCIQPGELYGCD